MKWTEEEINNRAAIATQRAVPSVLSTLLHLAYSLVLTGFPSPPSILISTSLLVLLFSIHLMKQQNEQVKKWAVFAYYESTQSMVMAAGFVEPNVSGLLCMASTSVLAASELSPLYSKSVNLALCVKHISCWISILSTSYGVEFWPHGVIPTLWTMLHVNLCVDLKKKTLEERSANLEALKQEEKRLAGLLQAVSDGIVVLSERKEVIARNKAFEAQLNLSEGDNIQSVLHAILNLKYAEEFITDKSRCFMRDVMEFIDSEVEEVISLPPVLMGSRYLEWRGSVMQWDERKVCVLIVRDSTKWIQLEKQAHRESANKTALLRSVSHELRTPTNAILNLAIDLKSTEEFSEQGKADISMVISATSFLLSLINDLLDLSRIMHDVFSLSKKRFVLEDTIKECLHLLGPQCRMKNIQLKARIDSLLPMMIYSDQNRLRQIVLNLLSNSLKYHLRRFTLKGSITVVALLTGRNQLRISVEDTGIGVKPAHLQSLFSLFTKLDQPLNTQGCGLGLNISNLLVAKMGGTGITVQSELGKGSTFTFEVDFEPEPLSFDLGAITPVGEIEDTDAGECQQLPETHIGSGSYMAPSLCPKVLVVDDSAFNRAVAQKLLEAQGFETEHAINGSQALEVLEKSALEGRCYLFVLMDIEMPEMDGLEATRAIRGLQLEGKLPRRLTIIGCSANCSTEDRESALIAGMNDFLEKPIVREQLRAILNQYFVLR